MHLHQLDLLEHHSWSAVSINTEGKSLVMKLSSQIKLLNIY